MPGAVSGIIVSIEADRGTIETRRGIVSFSLENDALQVKCSVKKFLIVFNGFDFSAAICGTSTQSAVPSSSSSIIIISAIPTEVARISSVPKGSLK